MERRCENCGQPALASDKVCWHCGWQLLGEEKAEELDKVTVRQGWQQPANLPALIVYAGLTGTVLVLMLVVMGWLGRRPLIEAPSEMPLAGTWQAIMTADESVVLSLPEGWVWLDGTTRPPDPQLAALLESENRYRAATYPLGEELSDLSVVMLAATPTFEDSDAFAIVATSQSAAALTPENAVQFLQEAEFENSLVLEVRADDTAGGWPVHIATEALDEQADQLLRCQQELIVDRDAGWLVSACVPVSEFLQRETVINAIVDSFRPLTAD